jgi:alanyl-tRNA synthetase
VHVDNTAKVRLVRLIGTESIRGRLRIYWRIGDRAIAEYRLASSVVQEACDLLSAQPPELVDRVRRQEERVREAEAALKKERQRACRYAAEMLQEAAVTAGDRRIVTHHYHNEAKDFIPGIAKELSADGNLVACLTNATDDRLQWVVVAGAAVDLDFGEVRDRLLPLIDAKGGGKPPMWQGIGSRPEASRQFLSEFSRLAERSE